MKKRIGVIIAMIAASLVICLLTWRFWPRSSSKLISVDENSITGFSAAAMVHRLENGQTLIDTYCLDSSEQQSNDLGEIVGILATSSYQQDFRNLLPWDLDYVDSDKNYDGRTVMLVFYMGNQIDEYVQIQFLSSSIIAVFIGGEDGYQIYHPTNSMVIDALVEYLQTNGAKQ